MTDLHTQLLAWLDAFDGWTADDSHSGSVSLGRDLKQAGAALRAVVEPHEPFQRSMLTAACRACSTPVHTQPGRYVTVVNWPCSTIQGVADALGVTDQELIEKEQRHG